MHVSSCYIMNIRMHAILTYVSHVRLSHAMFSNMQGSPRLLSDACEFPCSFRLKFLMRVLKYSACDVKYA